MKVRQELDAQTEAIATAVVHAAYRVHSNLGPGLLEKVYEICLCHELSEQGYEVQRQVPVPIEYDQLFFEEGFRIDVLVGGSVLCELKSVIELHPVFQAQLITYLKLTKKRLGFLINFNVPRIKDGIKRIIV
jgi:GxxExxY protein